MKSEEFANKIFCVKGKWLPFVAFRDCKSLCYEICENGDCTGFYTFAVLIYCIFTSIYLISVSFYAIFVFITITIKNDSFVCYCFLFIKRGKQFVKFGKGAVFYGIYY